MKKVCLFFLMLVASISSTYGYVAATDLTIQDFQVKVKEGPLVEGDTLFFMAVIANETGEDFTAPSSPHGVMAPQIKFYAGDVQLTPVVAVNPSVNASVSVKELAAGETFTFEGYWLAQFGDYDTVKLRFTDYYGSLIAEKTAEGTTGVFSVQRKYANDLALLDMSVSSQEGIDTYYDGDKLNVSVTVKNQGRESQDNVAVGLYCDGTLIENNTVSLVPESESTISFEWQATSGQHTLEVILPEDEISENDTLGSQVLVFSEGDWVESFEGSDFPPQGWSTEGNFYHDKWGEAYHGSASIMFTNPEARLITPKLDIKSEDVLGFALKVGSGAKIQVTSSVDYNHWVEVGVYEGNGTSYELFSIDFSKEEYSDLVGERYFSFSLIEGFGYSSSMDLVYGPQPIEVESDFSLLSVELDENRTPFMQQGDSAVFNVTVENKGKVSDEKEVFFILDKDTVLRGGTGVIEAGTTQTVPLTWIPSMATPVLDLQVAVSSDDAEFDNRLSFTDRIYPEEGFALPYTEGFEDADFISDSVYGYWLNRKGTAFFPAYWEITNTDKLSNAEIFKGKNVLFLYRNGQADTANLITPLYGLPHEKYTVSFYIYRPESAVGEDKVAVYFNTVPSRDGAVLVGECIPSISADPVMEEPGWYLYSFEFDARGYSQGFFIISGVSSSTYERTYLDEWTLSGISSYDIAVVGMTPSDGERIWGNGQTAESVSVQLCNVGETVIRAAEIGWSLDGIPQDTVKWEGELNVGDTVDVMISGTVRLAAGMWHHLSVEVFSDGDTSNTANNVFDVEIDVPQAILPPYTNGFETDSSLDYWVAMDIDGDGFNWKKGSATPHGGSISMVSHSFDYLEEGGDTVLTPDNWLVMPAVFVSEDSLRLSFFVGGGAPDAYDETYQVLVSTKGIDTSSFSILHEETLLTDAYEERVIDLTSYRDSLIFIAFRHFNSTDNFYLSIDDVQLSYPQPDSCKVTLVSDPLEGGVLTGDGWYVEGDTVRVVATPSEGYSFVKWTLSGDSISADSIYTFVIDSNVSLVACFLEVGDPDTVWYTVVASVEGNGSISPSDTSIVAERAQLTYTIVADEEWTIGDVLVDGKSIGVVDEYTFTNISNDHSIHAIFEPSVSITLDKKSGIVAYPNPTSSHVMVYGVENGTDISVYGSTGVLLQKLEAQGSVIEIDLSGYTPGLYIIKSGSNVFKVVKD